MRTGELDQDRVGDSWPAVVGLEVIQDIRKHLAGANVSCIRSRVKSCAGVIEEASHCCCELWMRLGSNAIKN